MSANELMAKLGDSLLIGSGAIGTNLRKVCAFRNGPIELLNLQERDAVSRLYAEYKDAGSQILIANTFAANIITLEEIGMSDKCEAICSEGVNIAREIAGDECTVWGSVGPLSLGLRRDDYSLDELVDIYKQQCNALNEADAIVMETFIDLREATAALNAAKATGLPIIFQVGNTGRGVTRWHRVELLLEQALKTGVAAVGVNCRHPNEIVEVLEYLSGRTDIPLTASANAGNPHLERGAISYEFSAGDLAGLGVRLQEIGVSVIGGCCGTTPDHIKNLAAAVKGMRVAKRKDAIIQVVSPIDGHPQSQRRINKIRNLIKKTKLTISVEMRADRKNSLNDIISGAAEIATAGVDMFDVPDNPGATVGRDAMVVACRLQEELNIPSFCHKTVTQSNLLQLHSALIGCWDSGLDSVLAVTGDPPAMGHLGGLASRVTDIKSSVELIRLIKSLYEGRMINGEEVGDAPDLCPGCAVGKTTDGQLNWLRKKIDAGAEFAFSQPIFCREDLDDLLEKTSFANIRIFPGIMPLTNIRIAEFLASGGIPGIRIPETVINHIRKITSPADQRKQGLEKALELAHVAADLSKSVYLIMPFGKKCYSETAAIVKSLRS